MFEVFVSSFKYGIHYFVFKVNFHVHSQFCVCDFVFLFFRIPCISLPSPTLLPNSVSCICPVDASLVQKRDGSFSSCVVPGQWMYFSEPVSLVAKRGSQ